MLNNGTLLHDRYRIDALLGEGGMGAVYRAWDLHLRAAVAVKEMRPQPHISPTSLYQLQQQFEKEALTLAHLSHPGLVSVNDYFAIADNVYLVMGLVEGDSLAQRIERLGAIPESIVLQWANKLLDALDYCHQNHIIHRDIKPQNIIINAQGMPILVDFGLVKLWNPADPRTQTVMRGMGTPEYSPPEQYDTDSSHTDPRTDLYSLAATLFHALTGQVPPTATQRIVQPEVLTPASLQSRGISAPTTQAIWRALALQPTARFATAREMKAALMTPLPTLKREVTRSAVGLTRWVWAVFAFFVLLVGVGLGVGLVAYLKNNNVTDEPGKTITAAAPLVLVITNPPGPMDTAMAIIASTPTPRPQTPTTTLSTLSPLSTNTPEPSPPTSPLAEFSPIEIPAGPFIMGTVAEFGYAECQNLLWGEACQLSWFTDEQPVHTVYLDRFFIDPYEVTNAQFATFLNAKGNQREGGVLWLDTANENSLIRSVNSRFAAAPGYENHPAIQMTWFGANAFCQEQGGRLPTEAEWEKAARGPQDERLYPWGDVYDSQKANLCDAQCPESWGNPNFDDGYSHTAPVGSFPAGASYYGVYDMAGNVFEWTADWYSPDYYTTSPDTNPSGAFTGERRVTRGGSWYRNGRSIRLSYRYGFAEVDSTDDLGFRCVYTSSGAN
ncbi:MAG: SUMF1/EgtB/PvdO family nonheme iron enzyme [Chloroflexi bacterium]|nr:SUMF1/EgtB/PvdO family nonheme iron enzyme [Chloroflexota bacterium]MBP8058478.1 SUMF1/EgtB/PvdO family nonheme iron enzyme [Chloroflexota bacterium]